MAAAFVRLCVETQLLAHSLSETVAAAFVRLCVETTHGLKSAVVSAQPPSCGCVLKLNISALETPASLRSRLRAAVC